MRLAYDEATDSIRSQLSGRAKVTAPYTTPWRVVMVAPSPNALLQNNDLFLNLNDPCAIEDTSWIRPGTVIREVTLSTAGGKACVDFAVQQGIDYIHFDAGWYGNEYDESQDATTVTPDMKRTGGKQDLNLQEVIRYAAERGVGVWVYVNRLHLEKQLDTILPLYRDWGIKGVKYGFVQVGNQRVTTWLHEAVRKAADHHLMVDIHDEYRPTGYSRTYPNLLTQEGIRGNEEMPSARHNVITAYTRMLCGAGDYTICWYTPRIQTTHPHQLAASVVFYSPLQFVYWYDKPEQFRGEPGTRFLKDLPTVWDDTRILGGDFGEHIVIARRRGEAWFLGVLNAQDQPALEIPLDFLRPGVSYRAALYEDCTEGEDPFCVQESNTTVTQQDTLKAATALNGGFAARLVPVDP
jgi:alpha-glucosidase